MPEVELCPGRWVGDNHPVFVIAELGQNHQVINHIIEVFGSQQRDSYNLKHLQNISDQGRCVWGQEDDCSSCGSWSRLCQVPEVLPQGKLLETVCCVKLQKSCPKVCCQITEIFSFDCPLSINETMCKQTNHKSVKLIWLDWPQEKFNGAALARSYRGPNSWGSTYGEHKQHLVCVLGLSNLNYYWFLVFISPHCKIC